MNRLIRDASIQTKLMFSHIILIAIPTIVIVVFFYNNLYNLIVNDSIRQALALSRQTSAALGATIGQVDTISSAITGSSFMSDLFADTGHAQVHSSQELSGIAQSELKDFRRLVDSEIDGTLITDIHIYSDSIPDSLYHNKELGDFFLPGDDAKGTYWHGIFSSTSRYSLYCPSFYLSDDEIEHYGQLAYIIKIFPGNEQASLSPSYLAIYFSSDQLSSILKQDISVNNGVFYILNERNSIVASSDQALAGTYFMNYDTVRGLSAPDSGFTEKTVLGQKVYAVGYALDDTDWYMVSILPATPVLRRGYNVMSSFAILYLALLGVAFIVAYRLSSSITKRVGIVNRQMRMVREGPPVKTKAPEIHDEIGELTDSYNFMTDEMNTLIENQRKSAEELRISEVRALQAQINPHFLYNTMDMINWLSQTGKQEEVTNAIQALSKFYKLTLSNKNVFGTVASELEHVTLYVQLQNMRYENKIEFFADIPEELMDYDLPKLTFQPIVENSIQHGILERPGRCGSIVLTGWREAGDLVILVSDDGVGMTKDKVDTILTDESESKTGNNIAVRNTHQRLRLLYGDHYGLTYHSTPDKGTDVEIRIPASVKSNASVKSGVATI